MSRSSAGTVFGFSTVLGGVSDVASSLAQADAIRAANEDVQNAAASNQRLAALRAEQVRRAGRFAAQQAGKQAAARLGARRAAGGASGVVVDQGSGAAVQASDAREAGLDQLAIHNDAWAQAWGVETDATETGLRAKSAGMAAENQANTTLLTGGLKALRSGLMGYYAYDRYFSKAGA